MTEIVMSIKPEWVQKIFQLRKTWEIRKRRPNCDLPVKCYIWQTEGGGVVGEFICDRVFDIEFDEDEGYNETYTPLGFHDCLTDEEFDRYLGAKDGSGWHISNLVIYDETKELSEFTGLRKTKFGYAPYEIKRPPQSYCYVEELP